MLRIVTGPFHPALDRALVEGIRSCKTGDPFVPLAVIVPSASLVEQLKQLLTHHEKRAFLNIHFLTFHQLALRLRDDFVAVSDASPGPTLQLVDDFFFEQLVRQVVQRKLTGLEPLLRLPASPGTWKGLWATVRDLKDAVVEPTMALKALTEGVFEEEDRTWLRSLFTLHAAMMEASRSLGVGSPDDLAASLGRDLSRSSFLSGLQRLFYYGFYDLSQIQLSFFESVIRVVPTTLYFPLQDRPAFLFARNFFERHLLPLADTHEDWSGGGGGRTAIRELVELSVTNVIGVEEELATVCRELLTLVEVNGYRFDEIGVVARTLEPYQARLQSVFDHHLVPFTSTAGRPLSREPLVKTLLRLASLPLNDFDRAAMLDVVTSPFYLAQGTGSARANLRPDIWRSLVYTLGITKGEAEWKRLAEPASSSILRDAEAGSDEDGQTIVRACGKTQLIDLWEIVSQLIQDCRALPAQGSIGSLTDAFLALVQSHVHLPELSDSPSSESEESTDLTKVGLLIRSTLARLQQLDPLGGNLSWEEWVDLFRRVLDETSIPIEENRHQGVQVLDAMTARGRTVRALFVLGMNEKLFPRYVREDPFLRDRQRVVLESTLGYKIDEKLAGHEEELLLFELLSRSATNRLYLSYQRADESGRVMAPSSFIAMAMRDPRFFGKPEVTVPRRLTIQISEQPSIQDLLPIEDLVLGCLLQGHDASRILDAMGRDRPLFEQGLATLNTIERESPELGPFDGMVGAQEPAASDRSFSPTALERYATCPFQYFAEKVLRLEPVRRLQDDHLLPIMLGTLVHESLRVSYEQLLRLQWPDEQLSEARVGSTVHDAVTETFTAHAASQGTGHALLWTLAREQVTTLVAAAVSSDQEEYLATGFRPVAFEAAAQGTVPLAPDASPASMKIHGTLDRVDFRAEPPALRIIDYKFKQGSEISAVDRNLALSAVRGFRLQPPLYAQMTLPSLPAVTDVQLLFLAPDWNQQISRSTFDAGLWTSHTGDMIRQTLSTLIQGIANREFFILPDSYCDYCEFSGACRRHDAMAWWRSYRSPQARAVRRLRKQKVSDE